MQVVAVVLNWNGGELTLRALDSLAGMETICVDNGSTDGSAEKIAAHHPDVELIRTGVNLGYSGGNNVGIRRALARGADWVLLLNNDAVADPGLAAALAAAAAARPDAGVLACKVYFEQPPDVVMYAGADAPLRAGHLGRPHGYGAADDGQDHTLRDVGRATGAAMAVSRAAIESAGMLDEELFAYVEDVDWCVRIRRAGFGVVFVPDAHVHHAGSAATGGALSPTSLYYDTRNTIAVCERHAPLPRGATLARRLAIVAAHLAAARGSTRRAAAVAAVVDGWRDARRGRLGRRRQPSSA